MDMHDFDQLVAEGYEQLPEWVRQKITNVALLTEDEPSEDDRTAQGLANDETLLGLYKGIPLTARGENYGVGMVLPDTITLYRLPILDAADEEVGPNAPHAEYLERVRTIVTETIWHEFAHHFGMDEHEVREREEKRDHPHTEIA
jgi:predicted Zn-dependent protease with MMP-like domain